MSTWSPVCEYVRMYVCVFVCVVRVRICKILLLQEGVL